LTKAPSKITAGEIVRALDGDITPIHCAGDMQFKKASCKLIDKCVTKKVWRKLKDSVDNTLNGVTLEDLCNDAKKMGIDKAVEHKYVFNI
jgi:DNA-binding IscR family transcriptional regulator